VIIIAVDLVTETDRAVETLISTSLREKYPNFEFMGEVHLPYLLTPILQQYIKKSGLMFNPGNIQTRRQNQHSPDVHMRPHRRHNKLCPPLPLRLHLPRPSHQPRAHSRHRIQPLHPNPILGDKRARRLSQPDDQVAVV
jgi:hypothetical protein